MKENLRWIYSAGVALLIVRSAGMVWQLPDSLWVTATVWLIGFSVMQVLTLAFDVLLLAQKRLSQEREHV